MLWLFQELSLYHPHTTNIQSFHHHSMQIQLFTYTHSYSLSSLKHPISFGNILLLSKGTYVQVRQTTRREVAGRREYFILYVWLMWNKRSKRAKKSSILFPNATNLVFSFFHVQAYTSWCYATYFLGYPTSVADCILGRMANVQKNKTFFIFDFYFITSQVDWFIPSVEYPHKRKVWKALIVILSIFHQVALPSDMGGGDGMTKTKPRTRMKTNEHKQKVNLQK